jgi:hypothetical protein
VDVVVTIHEPQPEAQNYFCSFLIEGIPATSIKGVYGVDAIQALQLALQTIGAILYTAPEYQHGRLRWLDDSGDLGFPRPAE